MRREETKEDAEGARRRVERRVRACASARRCGARQHSAHYSHQGSGGSSAPGYFPSLVPKSTWRLRIRGHPPIRPTPPLFFPNPLSLLLLRPGVRLVELRARGRRDTPRGCNGACPGCEVFVRVGMAQRGDDDVSGIFTLVLDFFHESCITSSLQTPHEINFSINSVSSPPA